MQTYVTPVGFYPTSVTRPILSHGLDNGDVVTLLRPVTETDDRRAKETLNDVERTLEELEPDVSLQIERLPHDDFPAAVLTCSDVLRKADGKLVVILGGGARDIFLPFTIAGLTHLDCIGTILSFSDIDGAVRELNIPNLTARVPDPARETLVTIERVGGATVPSFTEHIDRSKSTITRHINELEAQGVVTTEMRGKTKFVEVSLTGQLLLRAQN